MARNLTHCTVDKAMSSTKDEYMVWLKLESIKDYSPFNGSLCVMQARIFGLSYPDFLRYVRDTYGARIGGKQHRYPALYFPNEAAAVQYANILNKRYSEIIKRLT